MLMIASHGFADHRYNLIPTPHLNKLIITNCFKQTGGGQSVSRRQPGMPASRAWDEKLMGLVRNHGHYSGRVAVAI
jgi:hypothetical protein